MEGLYWLKDVNYLFFNQKNALKGCHSALDGKYFELLCLDYKFDMLILLHLTHILSNHCYFCLRTFNHINIIVIFHLWSPISVHEGYIFVYNFTFILYLSKVNKDTVINKMQQTTEATEYSKKDFFKE